MRWSSYVAQYDKTVTAATGDLVGRLHGSEM